MIATGINSQFVENSQQAPQPKVRIAYFRYLQTGKRTGCRLRADLLYCGFGFRRQLVERGP
jgi:hypothetical protein